MNGKLMIGAALCFVLIAFALMPLAVAEENPEKVVKTQEFSKSCFCDLYRGDFCVVPVNSGWGTQIGWYEVNESSDITHCVYSSGDWLIDTISFRTGKDYSISNIDDSGNFVFEPKSKFVLNCWRS